MLKQRFLGVVCDMGMVVALCLLLASPSLAQTISTVAGNGTGGSTGDGGQATSAQLFSPKFIIVDNANDWLIADRDNHKIRKVNVSGFISTFAGTGTNGAAGDGGAATSAQLDGPSGVAVDASGNVYISDYNNHKIRKVDTGGNISTFAGTGVGGDSGDGGAATSAQIQNPFGIAVDASGNVYIADYNNHKIRKVDTGGNISTVAGNGTGGFSGDGSAATSAQVKWPIGVAVDAAGNIYIVDQGNHRIRKVDTSGNISTVAGSNATGNFSGDGGLATLAELNNPVGIAVDAVGNIYIGDQNNHRVRKVDTGGIISTIAGTGVNGYNSDGIAPTSAQLNYPNGVFVKDGYLFIADNGNHRIRRFALPPSVSSTSPTRHTNNVVLNSNISATFSQSMTPATATSFRAFGSMSGKLAGSYSGNGTTTLTFDPTSNFKRGEEIEVVFAAGATIGNRNIAGIGQDRSYVYRFRAQVNGGATQFVDYAIGLGNAGGDTEFAALADVDGDGDLDVGIANASSQQNNVYLNGGALSFTTAKPFGTGSDNSTAMVFGDVDGDGDVDIGVGNNTQQNQVYFNDGAGNFSSPGNFGTGSDASMMLLLGDVDGDGDLDMATGNTSNQQNVLYFNNGSGSFAGGSSNIGGTLNSTGIVLGDIDNDGDLDVGVGNWSQQNAAYLNDGAGNFTAGTKNFGTGSDNTEWVDFGDIDNDGDLDVAVGNNGPAQNVAYLNDGVGNFSGGNNFGPGTDVTYSVVFADVDADNDLDLAVVNNGQDVVYLNDGSGNFTAGTRNFGGASDNGRAVAVGDMDGDGDLDLVTGLKSAQAFVHLNATAPTISSTNPAANSRNIAVANNISATFSEAMTAATTASLVVHGSYSGKRSGAFSGAGTNTLTINPSADLRYGEEVQVTFGAGPTAGARTMAGSWVAKGRVVQFRAAAQTGAAQFTDYERSFGTSSDNTLSLTLGDVDADGDLDVAVGNTSQQNIVYLNQGKGNFATAKNFGTGSDGTYSTVFADIDGDGDLDVGVGNNSAQDVFYLNDGAGNWGTARNFGGASSFTRELTVGDVDADGDLDIGVAEYGMANNAYLNDGAGNFSSSKVIDSGSLNSFALTFVDVDNDGDLDAAIGQDGQQGRVYTNDGGGNFTAGNTVGGGSDNITWLDYGDVDGDGDADLAAAKNSGQQNQVFLNNGSGDFSTTRNFGPGGDNTEGARLVDLDGDGDLDVAAASATHANEAYLNDGSGNFGTVRLFGSGSDDSRALAVGDINGDGIIDLLAGNFAAGNVAYINGTAPSVSALSPPANDANATRSANLAPTFSQSMTAGTASSFIVHGSQRAVIAGTYGGGGTTGPTLNPTADFFPGEEVTVTFAAGFTGGFKTPGGLPLTKPYIWQFRAQAATVTGTVAGLAKSFGTGTDNTFDIDAADIDGDGDIDMVVGNSAGQNAAYLNTGAFTSTTNFGTGSDATQRTHLADIDGDGDFDVVVGNNGAQNIVYLNNGSGSFSAGTKNFGTGSDATQAIALGDFNGDGGIDVAVGNNAAQGVVYLNDGNGNLSTSSNFGGASDNIAALAVADVDADGDLDLAAAINGAQSVVHLNGGSANFGSSSNFGGASTATTSVVFGDVDGDNDADVITSNSGGTDEAYLNNGSGVFSTTKSIGGSGSTGQAIALGDVDGDGDLDALRTQQGGQSSVYLNDGSANFSSSTSLGASGNDARAVMAFDADGDGDLDIAVGNGSASGSNYMYLSVTPPTVSSVSPTKNARNIAVNSNISGVFSQAMTAASTSTFAIYAETTGRRSGSYSGGNTTALAFDPTTDFRAGEQVEAVFSSGSTYKTRSASNVALGSGYVWRFAAAASGGPADFSSAGRSAGGASDNSRAIDLADIDGDGDLDVLVANNGQQSAAYINGGSNFGGGTKTYGGASDALMALVAADLDGDGDADVATGHANGQVSAAYFNDGSGNFGSAATYSLSSAATQSLAVGDIDGNGALDIALGNNGQQNAAYLNSGSGNFPTARNFGTGSDATDEVALADVDGDGDLDVAVGNGGAQNAVYLNDGSGNFSAGTKNFGTGSDATKGMAFADVDGDGDLDAGVGNSSAQNAVYLNDGSGNFAAGIKNFGTGSDATEALVLSDVDGDGDFDIAVGNNGAQSAVYLNDGSGNFAAGIRNFGGSSAATVGLAFGDINSDGDVELAAALNGGQSAVYPNASYVEATTAASYTGTLSVSPGAEVSVLRIGIKSDGIEVAQGIAVTISDLSSTTGLTTADVDSLKVYASVDSLYNTGDSLLVATTSVNIGSATSLSFTHSTPRDSLRYYIVRAKVATGATAGRSFRTAFASGGLTTSLTGVGTAIAASDANKYTIASPLVESTVAKGLNGVREVAAGVETKLLSVGLTGNGSETFTSVALTLSDLSTSTGIATSDIQSLKLYASADTALNTSSDSLIATQSTPSLSAATTLTAPVADAPPIGVERFYIVSAKIDTRAVDGRAFKVAFAAGGISSSQGALGTAVASSDSHAIKIQIAATRLAFSQQPADSTVVDLSDEVVSGKVFSQQPIVAAQDQYGNVDIDFAETVTLSRTTGSGTLSGVKTKAFVNGLADYSGSNLSYAASSDGESFALSADDETGGVDLTAAASAALSADAVATKLTFTKQPDPLLDPGVNFAPDTVVVKAQNALGLTDLDYTTYVHLRAVAAEDSALAVDSLKAVPGDSILASGGAAAWTELVLKEADLIRLVAKSGTLQAALSNVVAIPGGLTAGNADSLVAVNALASLAGVGGKDLVFNALALRANGERMPLTELKVRPFFGGLSSGELRNIDVVYDADADGRVDSGEVSVLTAVLDDAGSGNELTLSVRDTLPADTLRHYLVVADLDHTVRSTDSLRVDLTGIGVGSGLSTGVTPSVPVSQVAGRTHVATGVVDLISAVLSNPRIGQSGQVKIVFDAVSDLAIGDEIAIDFPVGFDVSAVSVDAATKTPSGSDPSLAGESAGRTVVLDLTAVESRGRYELVLAGVRNPNVDLGALPLNLRTRGDDNGVIDADDPQSIGLSLVGLGQVRVDSLSIAPFLAGTTATLHLDFVTSTALVASDEVSLVFPSGFALKDARLAAASSTPSGVAPVLAIDTTANEVVLDLAAAEEAGRFALVLENIGLPNEARNGQTIVVHTRSSTGSEIDQPDAEAPIFSVAGQLNLHAGATLDDGLMGLAGTGGLAIPLTSFFLEATGEAIAPQSIALSASFAGRSAAALSALDLVADADGDGAIDSGDSSLAVSVGAIDAQGNVEILLDAPTIDRGQRQHYLVAGDFSSQLGAADQIRIGVVSVQGGLGRTSALATRSSGGPIVGPQHTASGFVEMQSVELENRQANQRGSVRLLFETATALGIGGQIELRFPSGFDLSQASIDTATRAPSGAVVQLLQALSTRQSVVLAVEAAEAAGSYVVALQGVVNSAAASGLSVAVSTRRADGRALDGVDPTPFLFAIEEVGLPAACRADFDGDGRVYFADLFLFGDAFGSAASTGFDLDGDGAIGFSDFFIFSEVFGQRCDPSQIEPGGEEPLALELEAELPGGEKMAFVLVRAGSFQMGSAESEEGRSSDEGPVRQVSLGADFYLGQYEVTQAQWTALTGSKPWLGQPAVLDVGTHPAVYISWSDAQTFIQALNAAAGDSLYRLPSEAEWEYAARAGTKTRWSFGDDAALLGTYAWTRTVPPLASELITHPVGSKRANAWDLYDMHGSSGEWVQDFYAAYPTVDESDPVGPSSGTERVLRGGGTLLSAEQTRSAARAAFANDLRLSTFGFRVLRRIP